jgi:hypothetical protein
MVAVLGNVCAGAAGGAVAIMVAPLGFPVVLSVAVATALTCVGMKRLYVRHLRRDRRYG